ncbi:MAG: chlorite dismutase family protein [Chloroflexi bacterium]|nr:chlorite dismutase family protein [Chloroflexota bacterium]
MSSSNRFMHIPNHSNSDKEQRSKSLTKRQYVRFAFYRIDPVWRRLSGDEQAEQKCELLDTIQTFNRRMLLRPYSLMGTRADAELLLWLIAESPVVFQELAVAIMRTRMGAYLQMAYSYFSQTKRSIYEIRSSNNGHEERLVVQPSDARYLFVYPFIKTRDWYQMSRAARQGMMDEHIEVGRRYPAVKLNTTYCFGLDDYEFIVAFETDEPSDFLDLVQDLRETEASRYTKQDTPLFSCINMRLAEALDALGGPAIAEPLDETERPRQELWTEACRLDEIPPGESRLVYHDGRQVALFNVDGRLYALSNRCSHARGPLSEGQVDTAECTVTCPWHYAKYDLVSGRVLDGVASAPVESFAVEVRDSMIFVGTKIAALVSE